MRLILALAVFLAGFGGATLGRAAGPRDLRLAAAAGGESQPAALVAAPLRFVPLAPQQRAFPSPWFGRLVALVAAPPAPPLDRRYLQIVSPLPAPRAAGPSACPASPRAPPPSRVSS